MKKANGFYFFNIIHKAMLFGMLVFAGVCFYLVYSKAVEPSLESENRMLQVIAIALAAGGVFAGSAIFKNKLSSIGNLPGNTEKFSAYRAASIMQWALLEAPIIFSCICFLLTRNYAFLAMAGALILIFAMMGPSKPKLFLQLGMSEEEVDVL